MDSSIIQAIINSAKKSLNGHNTDDEEKDASVKIPVLSPALQWLWFISPERILGKREEKINEDFMIRMADLSQDI